MVTRASAWTADKSGTLSVRDRSTGALSSRSYLDMRIKGAIAAVVHVDGTARVQTVH
jgi:predicted NodU family carbamoyl transferase